MENNEETIEWVGPGTPGDPNGVTILVSDGEFLPKGYRLQEFEVQARLGKGGFSIVYRAWDHALQRTVALKEYMPTSMARRLPDCQVTVQSDRHRDTFDIGRRSFIEEAVTLAKFDHPALVRVYRNFEANGTAYMVMQLVQGQTLDDVAKAMPLPSEKWLMDLLDPLTAALQIVHSERIVHRDIAPDNVMILEGTQRPLLLDFGAARQVIGDDTQNPTAMLKPSYAPIEQYPESGLQQGAYTDIYALAGVVHCLLTGSAPPRSQNRVLKDSYQPLAVRLKGKYSARLLNAVDHGLALKPDQRTATVAGFRSELGLDDRQSPAGRPRVGELASGGRKTLVWVGAAGVALLVVAVALYGWVNSPPELGARAPAIADAPGAVTLPPSGPAVAIPPPTQASASVGAPIAAPVDPGEAFARILQAASSEIRVSLTIDKPQLKVNSTPLRIRLQSSLSGYFYVLIYDTDGEVRLLFPKAANDQNRLSAGEAVTLPARRIDRATGLEQVEPLVFGEPTGPARLLAVVAPTPLDLTAITKGEENDYRVLLKGAEAGTVQMAQGARPVYTGRAVCESKSPCDERFGAADSVFTVVP